MSARRASRRSVRTLAPTLALTLAIVVGATACGSARTSSTRRTTTPTTNPSPPTPHPASGGTSSTTAAPKAVDICAYRGLGTWVDVYDYVPAFAQDGAVAPVTPSAVDTMKADGVHTLYLQVAKDDPRSPGTITDPERAAQFLERAHAAGIRVVAWYLPTHRDPALDLARALAMVRFRAGGQRFDGVALDIEGTEAVQDVAVRNQRLVDLTTALDRAAGTMPVGAIVYPPVATEVLNPTLWPSFPWRQLAPHVDVWLPMAYWTFRSRGTPYRDASRYVDENVKRLRADVGDAHAPVHVIGGIADVTTPDDVRGAITAAESNQAIGVSLYDFNTTGPSLWPLLRTTSGC